MNPIVDLQREYRERNLKGFEGDNLLKQMVEKVIAENSIEVIIETGTYLGGTTFQFSKMAEMVHTIEVDSDYFIQSKKRLQGIPNVIQYLGKSEELLKDVLSLCKGKNLFIWLDAHWLNNCPLLEELKALADSGLKPIIAIHDFKVPGKDFGFDSYNGQPFDFAFVEASMKAIFGEFDHWYNSEAEGAKRGCIFIKPKR